MNRLIMGPNAGGATSHSHSGCVVLLMAALAAVPWLRWRFSLRTLLIAMTLVAVVLGIIMWMQSG